MCNCGAKYEVTYPDGKTEEKRSATAARLAAAKVAGATWRKVS